MRWEKDLIPYLPGGSLAASQDTVLGLRWEKIHAGFFVDGATIWIGGIGQSCQPRVMGLGFLLRSEDGRILHRVCEPSRSASWRTLATTLLVIILHENFSQSE